MNRIKIPKGYLTSFCVIACALLILLTPYPPFQVKAEGGYAQENTFRFSNIDWKIVAGSSRHCETWGGKNNVWVAGSGSREELHLYLSKDANNHWTCVESESVKPFGFGTYEFEVITTGSTRSLLELDKNVVFGMFNYLSYQHDGTNEIDIEFSRWGGAENDVGNYTVYPSFFSAPPTSFTFPNFSYEAGNRSVHRFEWNPKYVKFGSFDGNVQFGDFLFKPGNPTDMLPQQPLKVHINLYTFEKRAPAKPVEIIIKRVSVPGV